MVKPVGMVQDFSSVRRMMSKQSGRLILLSLKLMDRLPVLTWVRMPFWVQLAMEGLMRLISSGGSDRARRSGRDTVLTMLTKEGTASIFLVKSFSMIVKGWTLGGEGGGVLLARAWAVAD